MRKTNLLTAMVAAFALLSSCSMQKKIAKAADNTILRNADFAGAHVGISLFDPSTQQYIYDHQGDKYFVPASNTKLFACYEAMKNLGDSLVGLLYIDKGDGTVAIEGNGDASFLMGDFKQHPVYDFLKKQKRIRLTDVNWKDNALGFGWAWDDYNSDYMNERSVMPIYGNLVKFSNTGTFKAMPAYFQKPLDEAVAAFKGNFNIRRELASNTFLPRSAGTKLNTVEVPFYTAGNKALIQLLNDTLKTNVELVHDAFDKQAAKKIYSQPTDSLLKIMMHRSDNFFAEQTLLMISNEKLGMMNDARIIDTLLKTDLALLPQKPKWVDGSGLSRYNLITPQDFVWILNQMKKEFKWERIATILPTGGDGTLSSYYKNYSGRIFAKTGSLSNHLALSGYIITKKGKQLIFSVLVNAELAPAANIRKGVERFLTGIIDQY